MFIYIYIYSLKRRTINYAQEDVKCVEMGGKNGGANSQPEPINVTGSNQARLECGREEAARVTTRCKSVFMQRAAGWKFDVLHYSNAGAQPSSNRVCFCNAHARSAFSSPQCIFSPPRPIIFHRSSRLPRGFRGRPRS